MINSAPDILQIPEEQNPNSYVTTITASDPYESIARYEITRDPDNLFNINSFTGACADVFHFDRN